ncbi:MAG: hypothetical protein WCW44_04455 [archaeon]|jgi:ribonuclease P protein subunit RPR2
METKNQTKTKEPAPKEKKVFEKKLKGKPLQGRQKLALERIYRLIELAEEMQASQLPDKDKYAKRYVSLAKRIGEKLNISVPKELKTKFCKKCFSLKVIREENPPFLIVTCTECKAKKKYSL